MSLFDVSHMGQATLAGENAATAMETLVPGEIRNLAQGMTQYTLRTNEAGGIVDNLMVTRQADRLHLVFNAARREVDLALIGDGVEGRGRLEELKDRALMALQGSEGAAVLARLTPDCAGMPSKSARTPNIGPFISHPIAMGYMETDQAGADKPLAFGAEQAATRTNPDTTLRGTPVFLTSMHDRPRGFRCHPLISPRNTSGSASRMPTPLLASPTTPRNS